MPDYRAPPSIERRLDALFIEFYAAQEGHAILSDDFDARLDEVLKDLKHCATFEHNLRLKRMELQRAALQRRPVPQEPEGCLYIAPSVTLVSMCAFALILFIIYVATS